MRISELTNTIKPKSPMTPAQAQVAGLKRNVEQDKLRLQQARERQRQQRSAAQNSNDSSVNVSVKQRHRCVDCCGSRLNGWRNVIKPLETTGSVVKNIAFYKMNGGCMTGIAQILSSTLGTFNLLFPSKRHAHHFFGTLFIVENNVV